MCICSARELDEEFINSQAEQLNRYNLTQEYGQYCSVQSQLMHAKIDDMINSQQRALSELEIASPRLYQLACQVN